MRGQLHKIKTSITHQIVIAVAAGLLLGLFFPHGELQVLSKFAKTILQWIRIIAGPFLFVSVLMALMQIKTSWSAGLKLIAIALVNTAFALAIGISLTRLLVTSSPSDLPVAGSKVPDTAISALSLEGWLKTLSPESLFAPFVSNEILWIALLALTLGIAVRKSFADEPQTLKVILSVCEGFRKVLEQLLNWILLLVPLVVFCVVSGSVSQYGLDILKNLMEYVAVVVLALFLQCALVYGTWIFGIAKFKWKDFWKEAKVPVFYSLGMNSSLATLPLTLKALKKLKVSDQSASLGAGVATNLNNDGIVLYEASAVFFIAHLHGITWDIPQMIIAALSCVVAAMGITGVPEAGFISLTVVVSSLGLPAETLPLLLSVDWIMARLRSAVNVMSDMTLSIAMDAVEGKHEK
jgi:DAACS family dicarboxylate/amino acid:cation (Na+ or H+) symporter